MDFWKIRAGGFQKSSSKAAAAAEDTTAVCSCVNGGTPVVKAEVPYETPRILVSFPK
jgi:hypothetical protein